MIPKIEIYNRFQIKAKSRTSKSQIFPMSNSVLCNSYKSINLFNSNLRFPWEGYQCIYIIVMVTNK